MSFDKLEKEQITKSVGKRIQECRQKAGLTQEQLSEKSGISQKHISRIEQGYHDTHFTMIYKIAKALNTSTAYLLGDVDDPDDKSFVVEALDYGFAEMLDNNTRNELIIKADKEHISVLHSICSYDSNDNTTEELYNKDFLPARINMVTDFILANKDFLQRNMPGIELIKKDNK